jgi:hypothetical protein
MSASKLFGRLAKFSLCAALSFITLGAATAAHAQNTKRASNDPFVAPFPPAIAAGKTVFLSNAGAAPDPVERMMSSGKPMALPFSQFYSAVQSWGRYQIVDSPAAADLVFEFSLTNTVATCSDPQNCQVALVEVVIYDAKTHFRLWTFEEPVFTAMLTSNFIKNFNQAMTQLMADLKTAASPQ